MIIVMWIFFSALVAVLASAFNRSGLVWFLFSIVLSPLIGIVVVSIIGKPKVKKDA